MPSRRCKAKTSAGSPCRAPATEGGLCFFHANPDKVRALGQAGGRKNRQHAVEPTLPAALNVAGVREILAQAILDVRANTLTPRAAGALAQLSNSLLRIIQVSELEERLGKLERQSAE